MYERFIVRQPILDGKLKVALFCRDIQGIPIRSLDVIHDAFGLVVDVPGRSGRNCLKFTRSPFPTGETTLFQGPNVSSTRFSRRLLPRILRPVTAEVRIEQTHLPSGKRLPTQIVLLTQPSLFSPGECQAEKTQKNWRSRIAGFELCRMRRTRALASAPVESIRELRHPGDAPAA